MPRSVLLLALLVSGCSLGGPSDADIEAARAPEADGVIVNRTSADIIPLAFDGDTAARVDLVPEFVVQDRAAVLASGEARALSIEGYEPGEDFVVFVFRVRGTRATYAGNVSFDGDQFERDDAVATLNRF